MNRDRLNIVQVSTSDVGGGAERIASDLHRVACDRGMHSTLAVGHLLAGDSDAVLIPNDSSRSVWARILLRAAPEVPGFNVRLSTTRLITRRAIKAVAEPHRAMRRARGFEDFDYPGTAAIPNLGGTRADVVHLHNLHGGYFDLRRLPQISGTVTTVLTPHDTWLTAGHCGYTLDCNRWLTGCGSCPHLWAIPAIPRDRSAENWTFKRDIYRRSHVHVAAPSRWVLDRLQRSILGDAIASARVIHNGVDQRVFRPDDRAAARTQLGLPLDSTVLVFNTASESNPYKDFTTIRKALPEIASRVGDRQLLMIALGTDSLGESGGDVRIVSVPYLRDPHDVARYLQASDLYIHAARAENHPLAILEAQSCGVATVASDVGGVGETLVNGTTGVLVPHEDAEELAIAAASLLANRNRLREMGRAAAEHARDRFGIERMASDYFALYEEVGQR